MGQNPVALGQSAGAPANTERLVMDLTWHAPFAAPRLSASAGGDAEATMQRGNLSSVAKRR